MAKLSNLLRSVEDNGLMFWCPGCECCHGIKYGEGNGPRWRWNGSVDRPTFTPSILVRYFKISLEGLEMIKQGEKIPIGTRYPGTDEVCHSFVTDGKIQFLNDCTHALVGQTVDLPGYWKQDEY